MADSPATSSPDANVASNLEAPDYTVNEFPTSTNDASAFIIAKETNISQAVTPTKLLSFKIINRLPPELRLMIWVEACQIPRVVDIRLKCTNDRLLSTDGMPAILQVNRESRSTALKFYSPEFTTVLSGPGNSLSVIVSTPPSAYVNWAVDIICPIADDLMTSSFMGCLCVVRAALTPNYYPSIPLRYQPGPRLYDSVVKLDGVKRIAIDARIYCRNIGSIFAALFYTKTKLEDIIIYTTKRREESIDNREGSAQAYDLDTSVTVWTYGMDSADSMPRKALEELIARSSDPTEVEKSIQSVFASTWRMIDCMKQVLRRTDDNGLFDGWKRPIIKIVVQTSETSNTEQSQTSPESEQ